MSKIFTELNNIIWLISVTKNYVSTQPGANYGLRLVLWVNQSDAYVVGSPGVGFRVKLWLRIEKMAIHRLNIALNTLISVCRIYL